MKVKSPAIGKCLEILTLEMGNRAWTNVSGITDRPVLEDNDVNHLTIKAPSFKFELCSQNGKPHIS